MRSLVATTPIILAFFLALVPLADAQVPTPPSSTMTVTLSGLPAEAAGLVSNATVPLDFTVDVRYTNVLCPAAGSIPVTIEVSSGSPPSFFTVTVDPTTGAIPVAAGPHPTGDGNVPAKLILTLKEIMANASVPITVKATAGAPSGCQTTVPLSGSAEAVVYANMTAPPPPVIPTPEPVESPGPGALMGIVAAVFAAAFWRRRAA